MANFHYRDPSTGEWTVSAADEWIRAVYRNIFNPDTISADTFFYDNNNANTISYSGWFVSDYIPVRGNTEYYLANVNNVKWFDADKKYISTGGTGAANGTAIETSPEGAAYCRFQAQSGVLNSSQMYEYLGVVWDYDTYQNIADYVPVDGKYVTAINMVELEQNYRWMGKRLCFIGDSFSALGYWQDTMCKRIHAVNHGNYAVSGGRWSDTADPACAYEQAQSMVASGKTPDVILCALGINDVGGTVGDIVTSSSIDDFDQTTFTGGMQACLNYLQNNYPDAIIYVGWTPASGSCNLSSTSVMETFIKRMQEVCLLYGVEYIETRTCGITKYSDVFADMWESGTGGGHPVSNGYTRIGEYMGRLMQSKR